MKNRLIRLCIVILFIVNAPFCFAGSKASDIYDMAQDQMVDGNYSKAAELFDSIST